MHSEQDQPDDQREQDEALMEAMAQRVKAHPQKMKLRKQLCEHPFGTIKRFLRPLQNRYSVRCSVRPVAGKAGISDKPIEAQPRRYMFCRGLFLGYTHFLLKGLAKVRAEWSLMTLAYNLKRV